MAGQLPASLCFIREGEMFRVQRFVVDKVSWFADLSKAYVSCTVKWMLPFSDGHILVTYHQHSILQVYNIAVNRGR